MTDREVSRLLTRCEQLERENEELRAEIKRLKDEPPIKIGDMVEVFQTTVHLWTQPGDIGNRGIVIGFGYVSGTTRDNPFAAVEIPVVIMNEETYALCDVRKVC